MLSAILQSLTRPSELQALVSYKFAPKSENIRIHQENLAKDESKRRCYYFLNKTSRSFAAVIQELDDQLRDAICLFYLVLRGLDTIEDDMTLPLDRKVEVLRSFDKIIYQRGWTFHESGPDEKDRELLVHFDVVIDEFLRLDNKFQQVIADITHRMGNGMADYATGEHRENTSVATIADFNLYCHYVAGLVGYGLSDLFSASGLESPQVAANKDLSNHMACSYKRPTSFVTFVKILKKVANSGHVRSGDNMQTTFPTLSSQRTRPRHVLVLMLWC